MATTVKVKNAISLNEQEARVAVTYLQDLYKLLETEINDEKTSLSGKEKQKIQGILETVNDIKNKLESVVSKEIGGKVKGGARDIIITNVGELEHQSRNFIQLCSNLKSITDNLAPGYLVKIAAWLAEKAPVIGRLLGLGDKDIKEIQAKSDIYGNIGVVMKQGLTFFQGKSLPEEVNKVAEVSEPKPIIVKGHS